MKNLTKEFKNYRLIHNFRHEEPLKAWVNEGNFNDIYKEDWNALMEVVDIIENLGFPVTIFIEGIQITDARNGENIICINGENNSGTNNKRLDCYNGIVEFIKWYNKYKK
jgi:hypothetical protein